MYHILSAFPNLQSSRFLMELLKTWVTHYTLGSSSVQFGSDQAPIVSAEEVFMGPAMGSGVDIITELA